jgi:hypothetical protein
MGLYPFTLPSCCRLFTSWFDVMGVQPIRHGRAGPELAAVGPYKTYMTQRLALNSKNIPPIRTCINIHTSPKLPPYIFAIEVVCH